MPTATLYLSNMHVLDCDDELGAFIYKSSLAAKSFTGASNAPTPPGTPVLCKSARVQILDSSERIAVPPPPLQDFTDASKASPSPTTVLCESICVQILDSSKDTAPPPPLPRSALPPKKRKVEMTKHEKYAKRCRIGGCDKYVQSRGLCWSHGAKVARETCSGEGCTNYAVKNGVCVKHGAQLTVKHCSGPGCNNRVVRGGVCVRHGAKLKSCSKPDCEKNALKGGVCWSHGAKFTVRRRSTHVAIENLSQSLPNR